jgi:hypothetical protein
MPRRHSVSFGIAPRIQLLAGPKFKYQVDTERVRGPRMHRCLLLADCLGLRAKQEHGTYKIEFGNFMSHSSFVLSNSKTIETEVRIRGFLAQRY